MASIKVPPSLPSPSEDIKKLKKAFQGLGTDEEEIIRILAHRNADQRRLISQKYEEICHTKLLDTLHHELSGDFWKAVKLWTMDPPQRDASLCREALKKKRKMKKKLANLYNGALKTKKTMKKKEEVDIIVEIACASSPDHLIEVRRAYCTLYNHSLEEDIGTYVKGPMRKLLLSLASSYRYDGEEVDEELVKSEAKTLHNAIANNKYSTTEEDEVIRIVSTRSKSQLKATFRHYRQTYGKPIYEDLGSGKGSEFAAPVLRTVVCCMSSPETHFAHKNSMGSELALVLRTVVYCISSPEKHFAQVLRTSIEGLGTDEDALTRVMVTRAEIDMERIKEEYQHLYNNSLEKDVVGDTSGDYKKFLLALLGCGNL